MRDYFNYDYSYCKSRPDLFGNDCSKCKRNIGLYEIQKTGNDRLRMVLSENMKDQRTCSLYDPAFPKFLK